MTLHSALSEYVHLLPWLAAWAGIGFVGGVFVAWRRNRWVLGPLLGLLLGPLGWIVVGRLPRRLRECPACSRTVSAGALVCRHCGADINKAAARSSRAALKSVDRGSGW